MDTCNNKTLFTKDGINHTELMYVKYLLDKNTFSFNEKEGIINFNLKTLQNINIKTWEKALKGYKVVEHIGFTDIYYTFEPITHKCLSNMQEHALIDCPSLKGMAGVLND
jgi:hypothetical protein